MKKANAAVFDKLAACITLIGIRNWHGGNLRRLKIKADAARFDWVHTKVALISSLIPAATCVQHTGNM